MYSAIYSSRRNVYSFFSFWMLLFLFLFLFLLFAYQDIHSFIYLLMSLATRERAIWNFKATFDLWTVRLCGYWHSGRWGNNSCLEQKLWWLEAFHTRARNVNSHLERWLFATKAARAGPGRAANKMSLVRLRVLRAKSRRGKLSCRRRR